MEMIEIRYSIKPENWGGMADISGSWKDFEILRQDILRFLESDSESILINVDNNASSDGWEVVVESLELRQNGDAVKVSVLENKILKIEGSSQKLEIFAAWLEFDENTPSAYHSHYEYFEGNEFINSKSVPLV